MASKSKKTKPQQKKPLPPPPSVTVRECLTWHYQKGYAPANEAPSGDRAHYLPTKGGVGQHVSRGYDIDPSQGHVLQAHADDGTVIEALRGWPRHRYQEADTENDCELPPINTNQGDGKADPKADPWMADLISHRFLTDAVRKRQQEEEEAARKEAAARAKRSNKGMSEAKLNRTSQLRAIALAEKVDVDPKDLWQMPRFKNKARAHLTTSEKKQQRARKGSGQVRSGSRGMNGVDGTYGANGVNGDEGGDPCVCYNNNEDSTYKYDDYFFNSQYKTEDNNIIDSYPIHKETTGSELYAV